MRRDDGREWFALQFAEARLRVATTLSRVIAERASKGSLGSGATLKQMVSEAHDTTLATVSACLEGIAIQTDHPGRRRSRMLRALGEELQSHSKETWEIVKEAVPKLVIGGDYSRVEDLYKAGSARHEKVIIDFRDGWAAPKKKRWHERHPVLYGLLAAAVGAALAALFRVAIG